MEAGQAAPTETNAPVLVGGDIDDALSLVLIRVLVVPGSRALEGVDDLKAQHAASHVRGRISGAVCARTRSKAWLRRATVYV